MDRIKAMLGSSEVAPDTREAPTRPAVQRKPVGSAREIEQALRQQVASSSQGQFEADEVPVDAALFNAAYIDSIGSAKLLAFIEERYGVRIEEVDLVGSLASVSALAGHILAECQTAPKE